MSMMSEERLIKEIPRAIVHLRSQNRANRFGLIFGAGISIDLGYPQWHDLVAKIANRAEVGATKIWQRLVAQGTSGRPVTRSLASVTQMLFSQFRERWIAEQHLTSSLTFVQELSIKTEWLKIIHHELYAGLDRTAREQKLENHPYLSAFLPIIKKSQLTVTYNFDDSLELMLAGARDENEMLRTRGYEVIDSPSLQCRHQSGVIYHPNGYLPASFSDGASADVVFSDDSFQDQLLTATTGGYLHLTNHLTRNTCLLVGLSLEDSTLQSMLRQNAVRNPGHVHYAVHFTPDSSHRDKDSEHAIFTANFESFGIYTLFLNSKEIKALADLIKIDESSFASRFAKYKPKYVYYLIGSVGSGKSTAAANFRHLITYDEWIDERLPDLAKPESEVSREKVDPMNGWIAEQFRKKNFALNDCVEGIHVVDRAPLDPLTFGLETERPQKAKALVDKITDSGTRPIVNGHIIELKATVEELQIRNRRKHKEWSTPALEDLLHKIDHVYGSIKRSTVCTSGRSAAAVAKEIARIIFLDSYEPVEIQAELAKHARPVDA
ncbi:MAG: SIR2 family protein [Janthinobacterium lividum]